MRFSKTVLDGLKRGETVAEFRGQGRTLTLLCFIAFSDLQDVCVFVPNQAMVQYCTRMWRDILSDFDEPLFVTSVNELRGRSGTLFLDDATLEQRDSLHKLGPRWKLAGGNV